MADQKINRERLVTGISTLRHFVNNSLGLDRQKHRITGFELSSPLLDAAAYNTYIETIGDKADTLYLRAKQSFATLMTYAYLDYIKRLSQKFEWDKKEFILAFDYTDEDFYGDVQGFSIHGWTGEKGVTGKFKFLTCSIVSDDIPEKIPLLSIPIRLGHYKSHVVNQMLSMVKPIIGKINLLLFDRGFYDKDLMYELEKSDYPYLIFVPKHNDKKEVLFGMVDGERKSVIHDFNVRKDERKQEVQNLLIFIKQLYDPRSEKNYDWVFATNADIEQLGRVVPVYKKRWRIETGFRVQDEAKIKCKSTNMHIRYFIFLFEQMLQSQWVCFFKEEVTFKKFLIEMHNVCKDLVENPNKSYGKVRKLNV